MYVKSIVPAMQYIALNICFYLPISTHLSIPSFLLGLRKKEELNNIGFTWWADFLVIHSCPKMHRNYFSNLTCSKFQVARILSFWDRLKQILWRRFVAYNFIIKMLSISDVCVYDIELINTEDRDHFSAETKDYLLTNSFQNYF